MKPFLSIIIYCLLMPWVMSAQTIRCLTLPNLEQMPSQRVLCMLQDSEGALWYGTEGGGLCRDDGLHLTVLRNDSEHPTLLGSNNVASLAEVGPRILIGTFHGAYVLDKKDFSVRRLEEVDDKRVDDILVTRDHRVLLTANCKIYEFTSDLTYKTTYPSQWQGRDVYVSHLHEDASGRLWATQWDGGLLCLKDKEWVEAPWPLAVTPTDVVDGPGDDVLWVGTVGQGIVRYHIADGRADIQPATGGAVCIDLQLSADGRRLWMTTMDNITLYDAGDALTALPIDSFIPQGTKVLNRMSLDLQGRLLVAGSEPEPFVVTLEEQKAWYDDAIVDGPVRWLVRERQGLVMKDGEEERPVNVGRLMLPSVAKRVGQEGIWATDGQHLWACTADSCWDFTTLEARPMAMVDDGRGSLWFTTGGEVHRLSLSTGEDEVVLPLPDVSALAFTADSTLWLTTIYGKVYTYYNKQLHQDTYASNEEGDGVRTLRVDSLGRLLMVSDRYVRLYDLEHQTLRQQSREAEDVYAIELQETQPQQRWSRPQAEDAEPSVSPLGQLLRAWWLWVCLAVLALVALIVVLRRRRHEPQPLAIEEEQAPAESQESQPVSPFVAQATALVEEHLADDAYSVEQLSADLCMSRMTFYRKIQAATGQKPTEFMRSIRLSHAAAMLREGKMSISEISYATGFTSVSYFSRSFRTTYGVPPTQFLAEAKGKTVAGSTTTAEALSPSTPAN